MLFHKYGGTNVAATNFMSYFSTFVLTKATVKLANGNTGYSQGIRIILCCFPNFSIKYPVGPVYYCPFTLPTPSHKVPSNLMLIFKRLHLNLLNIVTVLKLKVVLGDHPTKLKTIYTIFILKFVKANPQRNRDIFVPTILALSK